MKKSKTNQKADGLTLECEAGSKKNPAAGALAAFAFFACLTGAGLSMLRFSALAPPLLTGAAVIAAATWLDRGNKKSLFSTMLCAAILAVWLLLRPMAIDGTKLLLNRAFSLSESMQAYEYDHFSVSCGAEDAHRCMTLALVLGGAAVSLLGVGKSRLPVVLLTLLVSGIQIYYGVFAAPAWNVALFFTAAVRLAVGERADFGQLTAAVGIAVLLAALVVLLYPGPSGRISAIDESLRDRFDEKIEYQMTVMEQRQEQRREEIARRELNEQSAGGDNWQEGQTGLQTQYEKKFQGSRVGSTRERHAFRWFVCALLAAGLISTVIWQLVNRGRARKRRALFDAADCSLAIRCMFLYLMDWLPHCGIRSKNVQFSGYTAKTGKEISPEFAEKFGRGVSMWQEAAYSSHTMTTSQKNEMRGILDASVVQVKNRLSPLARFKIHCFYFL